ncbi:hypothetical protein, partial [Sansalvadorimonas verongulae]|uniref:hypothetical protein n=1 Tax=Sansalvadorimonas verongulae TaxID=2172824 RepID=UPI0038B4E632
IVLGDGEHSWLTRAEVEALYALSEQPAHLMPLILPGGRSFTVIFDRTESSPIDAQPVLRAVMPSSGHYYAVVIHLLTIDVGL